MNYIVIFMFYNPIHISSYASSNTDSHLFSLILNVYRHDVKENIKLTNLFEVVVHLKVILSICYQQVFVWEAHLTLFISISCNNPSHTFLKISIHPVIEASREI